MRHISRRAVSLAVASLVALAGACDSPSGGEGGGPPGRGPERISAAVTVGSIVEGETLEPLDVDTFHFQGTAGDEMVAFLQATGTGPGAVAWSIPGFNASSVESGPGSPELETNASLRFTLPETGPYTVLVRTSAGHPEPYIGPYRFQIRRVDRRPEAAPRVLTPGEAVVESIDFKGDVDRFVVRTTPGQRYAVFFQATGSSTDSLEVTTSVPLGMGERQHARPADPELTDEALEVFIPTAGDSSLIEVAAVGETRHRGPYRLMVYAPNISPESTPLALPLGAERRGESLDLPADIDVFTLDVDRPTLVNVVASKDPAPPLSALHGDTGLVVALLPPGEPLTPVPVFARGNVAGGTGTKELAPGRWTVRVSGGPVARHRGPYRIQALVIDPAPEDVAAGLAAGATVTERLAPVGDVDEFTFSAVKGRAYRLFAEPTGTPVPDPLSPSGIAVELLAPGEPFGAVSTHRWNAGRAVGGERLVAEVTGTYRVRITSLKEGRLFADTGSYRLSLESYPTTPERVPAEIAPGAVVTGESIDEVSDVDDFLLTATPGEELTVLLRAPDTGLLHVYLHDPATLDSLGYIFAFASGTSQLPVRVGPSGQVLVRVLDAPCSSRFCYLTGSLGPYRLEVTRTPPAPAAVSSRAPSSDGALPAPAPRRRDNPQHRQRRR